MNRADALRRHAALLALADPGRGGTPAERAVASRKAKELAERYDLHAPPTYTPPPGYAQPFRPTYTKQDVADAMSSVFQATGAPRNWAFDIQTGEASGNVKVHSYQGPANWRIEIF